ncbi:MAG: SulP family inorganic anion transporter [Flavobacteriales bacterium]|jgi:MFS superfamily sulfate permease-like transporter
MEKIQEEQSKLSVLKSNFRTDFSAGFLVFLLALPLSLGIAKASGFPAAMGVLTAMVGGLFTGFFKVSELSIKGPAAGLITISAVAVTEFGGGTQGWQMVCAVIVIMAILQIGLGLLKLGSLSDFFPHSAVHGMLAAIGIIIIAKQLPVLLGVSPIHYVGAKPIELLLSIPSFIKLSSWNISVIGLLSIIIMFGFSNFKSNLFKKMPAPIFVLLVAIPLTIYWDFKTTAPSYSLVSIGDFWGSLAINADFSGISTFAFWKYVIMFLFVSSLESLLTVKAIDNLDPLKRQSNYNGDLIGQGAGNAISGLLGGLPMISEVVRSSANIGYGAKTKWANFFHGVFLLLAMIFMIPIIELIPNSALAAMLIFAGYRLAAPKEFIHTYKVGIDQLAIFLVTIIITLAEDLLLGILAGIMVKFIIHISNGVKISNLFRAKFEIIEQNEETHMKIEGAAVFSNLIGFKKQLSSNLRSEKLIIDFEQTHYIDHSFMSFIQKFKDEKTDKGMVIQLVGLEGHQKFSDHPLSTRKKTI